jgi:hypothetical protein
MPSRKQVSTRGSAPNANAPQRIMAQTVPQNMPNLAYECRAIRYRKFPRSVASLTAP